MVIFTSVHTKGVNGYIEMARHQYRFLEVESARSEIGNTVFYWRYHESIRKWKNKWSIQLPGTEAKKCGTIPSKYASSKLSGIMNLSGNRKMNRNKKLESIIINFINCSIHFNIL